MVLFYVSKYHATNLDVFTRKARVGHDSAAACRRALASEVTLILNLELLQ